MTALLGDTVRFQRTPAHHPEAGKVVGRLFGSDDIEVEDQDAQRLRLHDLFNSAEAREEMGTNRETNSRIDAWVPAGYPV